MNGIKGKVSLCKGKTSTGEPCKVKASLNGYCLIHFHKLGNRTKVIKNLNKQVGWKK